MKTLGERVEELEKKVSMLQSENVVKTENPYEAKSEKEVEAPVKIDG
jgi:hypothetical protein